MAACGTTWGTSFGGCPVCSSDQLHVDAPDRVLPHPSELALLDHTQQLCLGPTGQLAHFVEEQGSSMSGLDQTDAVADCASERATRVTEQLGLEQLVGERSKTR